jgi:glutaredoxin
MPGRFILDVVSDVICPWCFLGKRRLDAALARLDDLDVFVRWRPFMLDPTIPPEGLDRHEYMLAKFGPERLKTIHDPLIAAAGELGIPFDLVTLDISAGDTRNPDYLKINPNGRVPAIVHDGIAIWESSAITMYLGEVFGVETNLYPALGPKRGEAMKWIAWGNVTLAEPASRLFESLPPENQGDPATNAPESLPSEKSAAERIPKVIATRS